jgi:FKBP-type peptidyl-prolyl cis-trans isomerase 2
MTRVRFAALLAVAPLVVAACSGDDADVTSTVVDEVEVTTTASGEAAAEATTTTVGQTQQEGIVVESGDQVEVHYVGTLDSGEQFDSSRERGETLGFEVGAGQMIAGFDQAVRGMAVGEVKTVRIEATDAYGEPSDEFRQEVPLADLPEGVAEGDPLFTPDGQQVTVIEINGDVAVIDFNHPLAGEALTFEIEMVTIDR